MPEVPPPSPQADDAVDDIGVAATLPVSLGDSGLPGLASPPAPAVDVGGRAQLLSALFGAAAEETKLGRFLVRGTLGNGGMGTVLEAVDPGLDRRVALKVLHEELDEKHTARLRREAQALAKLSHPNVVHVYEVGEVDGQTFVAMELVEGQTLRAWAQRVPRPSWRECVEVYVQVGEGLVAAHEEGLVHRDFKPANAIIDAKGRVRVLDFGLARKVDELAEGEDREPASWMASKTDPEPELDVSLTRTGAVLGTPAYMPPEQMRGGEADGRSDQFSFCVSLYEAVYGERPFQGTNFPSMLMSMIDGEIRPAPRGTKVPARLRSVLVRGLAARPDERWDSMVVLLAELRRLVAPRRSPWPMVALVGGLSVVAVIGSGGWPSFDGGASSKEPAEESPAATEPTASPEEPTASPEEPTALGPVEPDDATGSTGDAARRDAGIEDADPDEEAGGTGTATDGAEAPPVAATPPKKRRKSPKSDADLRRQLKRKLKKCGDDGTIVITADLVLPDGRLNNEKARVRGSAASDPAVQACADAHLAKFKLTRRAAHSEFETLEVKL